MVEPNLERDLISVFRVLFCVQDEQDEEIKRANPSSLEKWDSLGHINLIAALEQKFKVRFSMDEMEELVSFEKAKELVGQKIKEKNPC